MVMIRRVAHMHCIRRHKIHPNATESDFKKRNVYVYSRRFSDAQIKIVDNKANGRKKSPRKMWNGGVDGGGDRGGEWILKRGNIAMHSRT